MKRFLKIFTLFLLLFNSAGAMYGGLNLMLYPDGSGLGMPINLLQYSSFKSYFLPGLSLLLINGVYGLFVFIGLLKSIPHASNFVIIQGILLCGWIAIQVLLLRLIFILHPVMMTMGLFLIIIGMTQRQRQQAK